VNGGKIELKLRRVMMNKIPFEKRKFATRYERVQCPLFNAF